MSFEPKSPLEPKNTLHGVRISIKASPGSRANLVRGIRNGRLIVAVTAVAEKGRANKAIIKLLSKEWRIAKSRIQIVAGSSTAEKTLLVTVSDHRQLDRTADPQNNSVDSADHSARDAESLAADIRSILNRYTEI